MDTDGKELGIANWRIIARDCKTWKQCCTSLSRGQNMSRCKENFREILDQLFDFNLSLKKILDWKSCG